MDIIKPCAERHPKDGQSPAPGYLLMVGGILLKRCNFHSHTSEQNCSTKADEPQSLEAPNSLQTFISDLWTSVQMQLLQLEAMLTDGQQTRGRQQHTPGDHRNPSDATNIALVGAGLSPAIDLDLQYDAA